MGINLSLRTNAGVTGTVNVRQPRFGIDAGAEPRWTDEGRPGDAVLALALAVHDGHLSAGTADNAPGTPGAPIGSRKPANGPTATRRIGNAVTSLIAYKGRLYVATGKCRFAGSALPESDNPNSGGGVFRHEGGYSLDRGRPVTGRRGSRRHGLFQWRQHASSLYKPAGFFRYESGGKWTALPGPIIGTVGKPVVPTTPPRLCPRGPSAITSVFTSDAGSGYAPG